jgi:hypothetical protein
MAVAGIQPLGKHPMSKYTTNSKVRHGLDFANQVDPTGMQKPLLFDVQGWTRIVGLGLWSTYTVYYIIC